MGHGDDGWSRLHYGAWRKHRNSPGWLRAMVFLRSGGSKILRFHLTIKVARCNPSFMSVSSARRSSNEHKVSSMSLLGWERRFWDLTGDAIRHYIHRNPRRHAHSDHPMPASMTGALNLKRPWRGLSPRQGPWFLPLWTNVKQVAGPRQLLDSPRPPRGQLATNVEVA